MNCVAFVAGSLAGRSRPSVEEIPMKFIDEQYPS
jgi:hypothetical protein